METSDLNPVARESLARGIEVKSTNPKDILAVGRVPLWLIPPPAKVHQALAHLDGAKKYGPYNWREEGVSFMQYVSAAQRHVDDLIDGEDYAHDSHVHHAGHAIATLNIILDSIALGNLIDDRPHHGAAPYMHRAVQPFLQGVSNKYHVNPPSTIQLVEPELTLDDFTDQEIADEADHRGLFEGFYERPRD